MKFRISLIAFALLSSVILYAQQPGDLFPEEYSGLIANFDEAFTWKAFDCENAAAFEVVANPDPEGGGLVGKVVTTVCTWEGIILDQQLDPFDFSEYNFIKVQVFAPAAGRKVGVKIQAFDNAEVNYTVTAQTTVANKWETLFFDFSEAENNKFNQIALLPDYEAQNADEAWYFTHIQYGKPPISYEESNGMLLDFEDQLHFLYLWGCDGDAGFVELAVEDNPDPSGINTSAKVAWFLTTSACGWEGFGVCDKYEFFNFNERWVFKVKVYPPAAEREVGLKLEKWEDNADNPLRIITYTTVADEWEELTFDVFEAAENPDPQFYNRFVIFPDYHASTGDDDWYFDDIRFINPDEDVSVKSSLSVVDYKLTAANYPNPFNSSTTIEYTLPNDSQVQITIYNLNGEEIATIVDEVKTTGTHKCSFNGTQLASGLYLYKVKTDSAWLVKKILLIK